MSIRTIWSPYNEWGTEGPPYVVYPLTPTPQDIQSKGRFRVPSIYAVSRPGCDEEAECPPGEGMLPSPALLRVPSDPEVDVPLRGGGSVGPRARLSGGRFD